MVLLLSLQLPAQAASGSTPDGTDADDFRTLYTESIPNPREVIIAVIDTGIDFTHPDLADIMWVNQGEIPGDGIDNDGNGYIDDIYGWDFYNSDNTVCHYDYDEETKCYTSSSIDNDSHGTHVAGIIASSLGKVFNFTGVNNANMIIPEPSTREKFRTQRDADHYGSIDPMVYTAVCAGYGPEGADWVAKMRSYLSENISMIREFFDRKIPAVTASEVEGSFVMWIDWRVLGLGEDELYYFLLNEAYMDLDRGVNYGTEGKGFSRMNFAAPRSKIEESLGFLFDAASKRGYTVSKIVNE